MLNYVTVLQLNYEGGKNTFLTAIEAKIEPVNVNEIPISTIKIKTNVIQFLVILAELSGCTKHKNVT